MTSTPELPPLRRALLHPAWLAAVATLAVNDHLLKGSGLAPGWVTGKLSDIVGLFAAPLLLAVIVRVSTTRGWALAHVAVGVVFSAIQLSAVAAEVWSGAMGMFGFPWAITRDATDLLALPALTLSYALIPRLARAWVDATHASELVVATAGVMACVATSPAPGEPFYSDFEADVYLHNDNDYDVVVRIRELAQNAIIDCDLAEEDPAGYLREPLFTDVSAWTLAPDATMPAIETWGRPERACHAIWIDADNLAPSIVFWRSGQFPTQWVQGTGITEGAPGWISVAFDDEGRGRYETTEDLVFTIEPRPPIEEASVCTPSGAATRLAWGTVPIGDWRLGSADVGPDGCVQLDLRTGFEDELDEDGRTWEICLPEGAFPFAEGDTVRLQSSGVGADGEGVDITRLDPNTGLDGTRLIARTGSTLGSLGGAELLVDPESGCDPVVEDACGTVREAASISVVGGGFEAVSSSRGSGPVTSRSAASTLEVHLVHASTRLIVNPDCSGEQAGTDLEVVAILRDLEGE